MRQIRAVIRERQTEVERRDLQVRSIELQILASYVAAGSGMKGLLKQAGSISLLPEEEKPLPSTEALMKVFGGD